MKKFLICFFPYFFRFGYEQPRPFLDPEAVAELSGSGVLPALLEVLVIDAVSNSIHLPADYSIGSLGSLTSLKRT